MKNHYKKIATLAPSILLMAALVSCGGGGGGGGEIPALTFQSAVTSLPSDTYTALSNEQQIWDQLALIRADAGYLTQNSSLDNAASDHANYLVNNNLLDPTKYPGYLTTSFGGIMGGHYEASTLPGFTGASPQTRATNHGYSGTVTELMTFGATDGTNCVDLLGDSVYHLVGLISPFIDLGISFNAGGGLNSSACAIEVGVKNNTLGQLPATGPVFYPYDGQTNVLPVFYNNAEVPDPAPDLTTAGQSPVGHPIIVSLYSMASSSFKGSDIVIHDFSISPTVTAGVRILANSGVTYDGSTAELTTNNTIPGAGFVVLLPKGPLAASNTTYTVNFSATVKGAVVSKSWTFTTTSTPN
jgi:hypothetical protein